MEPGGAVRESTRLLIVPFGAAATDALATTIGGAKAGDPLAPVTVIVPGNLTGLALRRELGGRPPGVVNVRFFVLDRLAELVGAGTLAAHGRRPLDDAVKAALVRQVLARRPAPLERVASAENTEVAVIEFLDELAASGPDAVSALRAFSRRGAELAAIATSFRALAEARFYDEHDLAAAAAAAIESEAADLRDVGQVILHLPHRLTHAELALVDALAAAGRLRALVGLTGEADADAVALALVSHLEPRLGAARAAGEPVPSTTTTVSAPDAPAEVREAMRIVAAELEAGRPLHRIGIVYRQREPYARLLDEELAAAGIPMHGPAVRTLAQTVAGRTLLGALRLADDDFSRVDVMRWMSAAPIRVDGARIPLARWSRTARRAGVVKGEQQWIDRLGARVVADPEAALLAEFVAGLIADCGAAERPTWSAWADWSLGFLRRRLGSAAARRRWPEGELDSFDAVEKVVASLRTIDDLDPGPVSLSTLSTYLSSALTAPARRRGRFGAGVFSGPLRHAIGVDLDCVVVLGMAEGSFPPSGVSAAVLSDRERAAIGSRQGRAERARDERRTYLAATASAPLRWLTHPRVVDQRVAHASPWLLDEKADHAVELASYDGELAHPRGAPASLRELDLRALHAWPSRRIAQHPLVTANERLRLGISAAEARASDAFTEWQGHLGPDEHLAFARTPLSATSLEAWATCPAKYFYRQVLGVRDMEELDDIQELEPRERGNIVHRILERLGAAHLLDRGEGDQLLWDFQRGGTAWTTEALARAAEVTRVALDEFEGLGLAPYEILWQVERRRILADVFRTLDEDDKAGMLMAVEYAFGADKGRPFTLTLSTGEELSFRGTIDRVDRLQKKLRVIDYKTGKKKDDEDTVREAIRAGTLLQLPLYGLAAQHLLDPDAPVEAGYWYISGKGGWNRVPIDIDDEVTADFMQSIETIAEGVRDGVFPAHPGPETYFGFQNCSRCAYDRICPADRDRAWLRVESAPELQPYRELSTPRGSDPSDTANGDRDD